MKIFELLFLFRRHLNDSVQQTPASGKYITTAYNLVISKIKSAYPTDKTVHKSDIMPLDITDHMKNKLIGLLSKKLTTLEQRQIKQSILLDDLTGIIGIGSEKAKLLIDMNLTKISQLSQKKYQAHLPESVIMLIKYNPVKLIPHLDIKIIEPKLTKFKYAAAKLVGGFLRKKPFSRDIDVMLPSNKKNILDLYIKYLATKFDEVYVYAHGTDKVSLIIQIKPKKYYKIDVFRSPVESQHAMLLYATGSKQFNVRMRAHAKRKGYLLNQNGLFKLENGVPNKNPIAVKSERDFFRILGMSYVSPENR